MSSDVESLGSELREARLRRDLELHEVERKIHIRARFLEALEEGQVGLLPSQAQARGFIRNYARFLGFDAELTLARWDTAIAGGGRRRAVQHSAAVPRAAQQSPTRSRGRFVVFILLLVAFWTFIGVSYIAIQWFRANSIDEGNPSIVLALPSPSATAAASPSPTNASVNPKIPLPATPTDNLNDVIVELQLSARTYLKVSVDDQVREDGVFAPNVVLRYRGKKVVVRAANASAIKVVLNGRDLGALGARGQIVEQTYTIEALLAASLTPQAPTVPTVPTAEATAAATPAR